MSRSISRRQLGKGLIAGAGLAAMRPNAVAEGSSEGIQRIDSRWVQVAPAIWRATIGSPEAITPVSSRMVAPRLEALRALTSVIAPPIASPTGTVRSRGTSLRIPLAENEEIYG